MHSLTDSPLGMAGNMGIPGILDPRSTMQGNSLNGDYNVTSSPSPSPLRHQLPTIDEQRQIGLGINVMGMNASAQSQQSIHAYGRSGDTIGPAIHARNVLSDWQEYLQPCAASFGQMKPPLDSQHSATRPIYVEHDGPIGAFPRATDVLITAPTQPAQMPTDWLFPTGIMTGPHQTFSQIRMRDAQALAAEQAVP